MSRLDKARGRSYQLEAKRDFGRYSGDEMNFGQSGFAMQQGGALAGGPMLGPITAPHMAVDDFLPMSLAEQMRQGIDDHFAEPHTHTPETHQCWNYWYVPDLYTY